MSNLTINLQPTSENIWDAKHRLKDEFGNPIDLTINDTFKRVAKALSVNEREPEYWENEFYRIMKNGCTPGGRILSNAGSSQYKPNTTLINCVVASNIEDSLDSILNVALENGKTLKTGAGIGFCFSTIRPKGSYVKGVGACFTPETKIFDSNFNAISFKELKLKLDNNEKIYTYSCAPDGKIYTSKILKCWITKTSKNIVEVILDNNKKIRCTPDHKFMLKDGTYKEAKDLKSSDSLMPIYFKEITYENNLKRRVIKCNKTNSWNYAYHLSGEHEDSKISDEIKTNNLQLHHIDLNSLNDYPTNILLMDSSDHHSLHFKKINNDRNNLSKILLASNGGIALWEKIKSNPNKFKKEVLENRIGFHSSTWDENRRNLQKEVAKNTICKENNIKERVKKYKSYINDNPEAFSELQSIRGTTKVKNHINKLISLMKSNNITLTHTNFNKISKDNLFGNAYILFDKAVKNYPTLFNEFIDDTYKSKLSFIEKRLQTCINNSITELKNENVPINKINLQNKIATKYSPGSCSWKTIKYVYPFFEDILSTYNHSIISVNNVELEKEVELYDLEVDSEYHNFCLDSGIFVHNSTSGPLSFADIYDKICFTISSAGGRRGSMMLTFHVFHPDVYDVIKAKREDGRLRQFNISLLITDDFIYAVKKNYTWDLYFPIHKDDPHLTDNDKLIYADWPIKNCADYSYREDGKVLCKIYNTVNARHLWDTIMEANYNYAEPGFILIDKVNRENNLWFCENIVATNPCVTGDTLILTKEGYLPIETKVDKQVEVWNGYEFSLVTPKITGENQKLLQIEFSNGSIIKCTKYHEFISNNKKIKAKDLTLDSKIDKFQFPIIEGSIDWTPKRAYTQGFYSGDGELNKPRIWLYDSKINVLEYLDYKTFSDQSNTSTNTRLMVTVNCELYDKSFVPDAKYTIQTRLNWLAGIIDSDGTESNGVVQISSINKLFLINIKYLLNTLGADATIGLMKKEGFKFIKTREYHTQNCWRLSISKYYINKLFDLGLLTIRINTEFEEESNNNNTKIKVKSILTLDEIADKVYCFNEPLRHLGCFNGLVTGNCGAIKITPL